MKKISSPYFLALLLISFTLLGAYFTHEKISLQEEVIQRSAHRQVLREIKGRMDIYTNVLLQTRSMFDVTREVDRNEFKNYVDKLKIFDNYPGLQGIGFAIRINSKNEVAFEKEVSKGMPGFHVWPEGNREIRFPILYLEPQNWRNQRALGYDMYSEEIRHEAMVRAIDEDYAVITSPVELVQETKDDIQKGFLIYVPVYKQGMKSKALDERRVNILGLIYSPFRTRDLFEGVMENLEDLAVDVKIVFAGTTIFQRYPELESSRSRGKGITTVLPVAGKNWEVTTYPLPTLYPGRDSLIPVLILFFGSLLTTVVTIFLLRLKTQAMELAERGQTLQQIQDATKVLSSKLELKEVLQTLTDIGLELSKGEFGAFFYNTVDEKGESYMLYTLSGVERSKFDQFPMPRNTAVFASTFGGNTLLSPDITKDSRFGKNAPYFGLPKGHLPVKSYLAVPVKSKSGEVIGALFYGHSTSGCFREKHKDLIEGLSQQAAIAIDNATLFQEAQKAIASREEFLNIASHELKTPITSMRIQFQSAERMIQRGNSKVFEEDSVKKRIGLALRQLDKMLKLIEEMLDSSRISLGKFDIHKERFDFRKMVSELLERYEEQFRGQEITTDIDLGNPDEVWFFGDEYRLEQVLSNLLNNAIKYGETRPIDIRLHWTQDEVRFSVRDFGSGIPKENLKKIFERYERLVSAMNISGLGLGLYISKNIVEAHAGEIKVESELGKGSIFEVILPRVNDIS